MALARVDERPLATAHPVGGWWECGALSLLATLPPLVVPLAPVPLPQAIIGVLVNLTLMVGALHLASWAQRTPLLVLPPVAAVMGGHLFGPDITLGLMLFALVALLGNATLMVALRATVGLLPLGGALGAAALAKALLMMALVAGLVMAGLLPMEFGLVVAPLQLATALGAGVLALPALRLLEQGEAH